MKLAFAITPHHARAAHATVRILDARGNEVLSSVNDGPWLFTNLPNGIYRVTAEACGRAIEQTAEVGDGKQTELCFHW